MVVVMVIVVVVVLVVRLSYVERGCAFVMVW